MASRGLEFHVTLSDKKFRSTLQSMEAHTIASSKRIQSQFDAISKSHAQMSGSIKANSDEASKQFLMVQKSTSKMDKEIKKASKSGHALALSLNSLSKSSAPMVAGLQTATKNTESLTSSQKNLLKSSAKLTKVYQGVVAAISASFYASAADQYINLRNQIFDTTSSQEQFIQTLDGVRREANETNSAISETALVYARMRKAVGENVIGNEDLLKVTSTINRAIKLNGTTTQEAEGSLIQLSQALGAGALRGEEFNSVNEQMPAVLDAVAKHLGVARGELKAMAAQGELTSEIIIESLQRAESDIEKRFNKRIETMSEKLVEAKNNAVVFFGEFEANNGIARTFGDTVVLISENLDRLVEIATFAALVFSGKLVQGLFSSSGAFGRLSKRVGEYSKNLDPAIKKTNGLNSALGMRNADSGSKKISGLSKALIIGSSLIGGLPSLVIAAAAALVTFAANAGDAEENTEALNKQLAIQNRIFDAMDRREKSKFLEELNKQRQALIGEQVEIGATLSKRSKEDVQRELRDLPTQRIRSSVMGPGMAVTRDPERQAALLAELETIEQQEARFASISADLDEITKKQQALFASGMPEGTEFKSLDEESEKQRKTEEEKRKQLEKTTKTKLALIEKEIEASKLQGMTELDILKENAKNQSEIVQQAADLDVITDEKKTELLKEIQRQYMEFRAELAMTDYERKLEQAELELELQRQLFEEGLISSERLEQAEDDFSDKKVKIKSEEAKSASVFRKKEYSQAVSFLDNLGKVNEKFAKTGFFLTKAQKIGEAFIHTKTAVTEALPNVGKAAWAAAQGAAQIAGIAATSFGGGGGSVSTPSGSPSSDQQSNDRTQQNETSQDGFLVTEFSGASFGEGGAFGFSGQINASDDDRLRAALIRLMKEATLTG